MSLVLSGLTALAALQPHAAFAEGKPASVKKITKNNRHQTEKMHQSNKKVIDAKQTFKEFAAEWMAKLEKISKNNAKNINPKLSEADGVYSGRYVCYGPECQTSVKKTGSPVTPYVGMIHYTEKQMLKKGSNREEAMNDPGAIIIETPVTEIFRFSKGHWVY